MALIFSLVLLFKFLHRELRVFETVHESFVRHIVNVFETSPASFLRYALPLLLSTDDKIFGAKLLFFFFFVVVPWLSRSTIDQYHPVNSINT